MSNDLVPSGGSAALVVPSGDDGPVTVADVGDVSIGRTAPSRQGDGAASLQQLNATLVSEIQREAGLSAGDLVRARAVLQRYAPQFEEAHEEAFLVQQLARDERDKAACVEALRGHWWGDYTRHVETVRRVLDRLGEEAAESFLQARLPDGTALFNSPTAFLAFFELGRFTGADDESDRARCETELQGALTWRDGEFLRREVPEAVKEARDGATGRAIFNSPELVRWFLTVLRRPSRGAGASPAADPRPGRLRQLEVWMRSGDARYWKDERVQAEYRELLGQGVTGEAPANAPGGQTEVDREIADIERLMRDPRSAYFRGPDSERLQRRYLELVDARGARR